jgi:hypothetical protein
MVRQIKKIILNAFNLELCNQMLDNMNIRDYMIKIRNYNLIKMKL